MTVLVSNQADHPFITVRAYDADSVENAITYSIGQSSFSDFFDINPVTGDLFNTKSLVDLKVSQKQLSIFLAFLFSQNFVSVSFVKF